MDTPIEIFLSLIAFTFAMGVIGLWKKIPIMLFIAGAVITFWAIMTDNLIIGTEITQITATQELATNTTVLSYNVMSGVTNFTLRNDAVASFAFTEYASNSSSLLVGDVIQCISYELIRVGNAIPNSNVQFGVFSGTENFVQFYGNISASSISTTSFQYYTVCVEEGLEQTIDAGERIGIKYKYGNSTNFLRAREDSANPFDGTISSRSSMVTTTWAQSSTRDVNARFFDFVLTFDDIINQHVTPTEYAFTEYPKILFGIIGAIIMLAGAMIWKYEEN